ncbi:hypothetical protein FG379_000463 [Cryptosporidium bovis]|uniref:uncharacterized protein n=1 Tax=Cryptosporidium bovis TaxID=310047 RepID=UPI003519DD4E|nr:hypothetical protein FG379_000463 [Cryptosporidium bovis]
MSDSRPLTRGQRKRREALERVKRKQDLTSYLLKQKQLEKISNLDNAANTGIKRKKLYNFNKIKNQIESTLIDNKTSEANICKKNMTRKKMQKLRESSVGHMKEILDHPDFDKLDDLKSKLFHNIENDSNKSLLSLFSKNSTRRSKVKKQSSSDKLKKIVKVNKVITKKV